MRLKQYIFESSDITYDDIQMIKKDCKKFFYESRFMHRNLPLYRRMKRNIKKYEIITPRKNRKPRDTPIEIHKELDKLFKNEFGWKVRSEGVFCSGSITSSIYGNLYYMFPIGKFEYVWSPDIKDLTVELERFDVLLSQDDKWYTTNIKETDEILSQLIYTYKDDNFLKALESGKEIALKCDKYYAVNANYIDEDYDLYEELFKGDLP